MRLLLNVRGTSGSGKTTIVRKFMEEYGVEHIPKWGDKKQYLQGKGFPGAAKVVVPGWQSPIYFIGNYSSPGCGGLDTVYSQEDSITLAIKYLQEGHVICEGLLTSGLGPGGIFCKKGMAEVPSQMRFLFLNTTLEQCIENVNKRRRSMGNMEVFTDEKKHLTKKYLQIQNVIRTMTSLNYPIHMLDFEAGYEQVRAMLLGAEYESREEGT